MKAAVITKPGRTPLFADFDDPVPQVDEELVVVTASALSHVTKSRASGSHHTSPGSLPAVVGIDGVGRTQDGRRVYFVLPEEPFGGMAEKVAVRMDQCIPLPADVDDITAAAIAIPGMSSWAAFKERAHLMAGENVLINGATGTSGRLAVQIAKYMGAKRVIATGRNVEALERLMGIGADATVPLTRSPKELETAFKEQFGGGKSRQGCSAHPFRSDRSTQRRQHCFAKCCLALVRGRLDGQRHRKYPPQRLGRRD